MKHDKQTDKMILVEATQTGFFGHKRIRAGQRFNLVELKVKKDSIDPRTKQRISEVKIVTAEQQFSPSWMEKVEGNKLQREEKPVVDIQQNDNVEAVVI